MELSNQSNVYAVIVAIEQYRFNINRVKYAEKDAQAFYDLLVHELNVPVENVQLWIGQEANKIALEEELPYMIRQATSDDLFIFYYAGHGFSERGFNRITAWDTYPQNLPDTTVILKDVLLEPLLNSQVNKSLIFIDACATDITEGPSRDMLSQMSDREFKDFIRSGNYHATFLSCSPGEKSYSSDLLKHGIWTWHLLNALKGKAPDALERERYITSTSLQNYLRRAIPDYIQKNTEIRSTQTPWSQITSANTFEIREFTQNEPSWVVPLSDIKLNFEELFYRTVETSSISKLPGFNKSKGHFVPDYHSNQTVWFIVSLLTEQINEELDTIYQNSKEILALKRKNVQKSFAGNGGSIDTPMFRYYIDIMQNPEDPTESMIIRKLILLRNPSELPEDFNYIFPIDLKEIVIPLSGNIDFDTMVDQFEDLVERIGGKLYEEDRKGIITYILKDKTKLTVSTEFEELYIKPFGSTDVKNMLEQTRISLLNISSAAPQRAIEE
ncbi:hypothetical protein PMEGAS67_50340 [Priestia megaterium]